MSQGTELSQLLAKAQLECYQENLEKDLNVCSVSQLIQMHNHSDLSQIGMKKEEIECLQKILKGNNTDKHKHLKAMNCKSLDSEVHPVLRKDSKFVGSDFGVTSKENICNCNVEASQPTKSFKSESAAPSGKVSRPKCSSAKKLVQRSMSATVDHRDRSLVYEHLDSFSSVAKRCGSGADTNGDISRMHQQSQDNSSMVDVLSGDSYVRDTSMSDDTSPLIQSDIERHSGARHSFDNLATVESASDVSTYESLTASGDRTNDLSSESISCLTTGKRLKPALKISIPMQDPATIRCNLKPMSAMAERRIDEAIELASTLARMSAEDRFSATPRTPGSFSEGCSSPGGHFFFSLRKNRTAKEEKKTFSGLHSFSGEPDRVMTPAALEAYNLLVTKASLVKDEDGSDCKRRSWESSETESSSQENISPLPSRADLDKSLNNPVEEVSQKSDRKFSCNVTLTKPLASDAVKAKELHLLNRSWSSDHQSRFEDENFTNEIDNLMSSYPKLPEKLRKPTGHSSTGPAAPLLPPALKFTQGKSGSSQDGADKNENEFSSSSPPPLPDKKARKNSNDLTGEDSPPSYRAPSPPPVIPPPVLPPRIPLRPSTINSRPYVRQFPLLAETSNTQVEKRHTYSEATRPSGASVSSCKLPCSQASGRLRKPVRQNAVCRSIESRSSCESEQGSDSKDSVFSDAASTPRLNPSVCGRSASLADDSSSLPLKLNLRNVKLNAAELGIYDKADLFWVKSVTFDLPEKSQSESDLMLEVCAPIPGRYETSDCVSYEDLMEFALDGPHKTPSCSSLMCDEVRVLMKMFSNDITVEDCMDALVETFWDVHSAVKLIKLKQLLSTGLADKQQCKQALLFCKWNVNEAALYLLTPPQNRVTPDLVDV